MSLRHAALALALMGCQTTDDVWSGADFLSLPTAAEQAGPPPVLDMCTPPYVVPGEAMTFAVSGAVPGSRVGFAVGGRAGAGPCVPGTGGSVCAGLAVPRVVGTATADASGNAELTLTAPANLPPGFTVYAQSYYLAGTDSAVSNVVNMTIDADSSGRGQCDVGNTCTNLDDDANGVHDMCDVEGCSDDDAANYDPAVSIDNGSCRYAVTLQTDLSCYANTFTQPYVTGSSIDGWCGSCVPLADDDGDGVWSTVVELPAGDHPYKFTLDGWTGFEEVLDFNGVCNEDTNFVSYANRRVEVSDAPVVEDANAFSECLDCGESLPGPFVVDFQLDLSCYSGSGNLADGVFVMGEWDGWAGYTHALTDVGDGLYVGSVMLNEGSWQYIFHVGSDFEALPFMGTCVEGTDGSTFANRAVRPSGDMTVDVATHGACSTCDGGCTDSDAANYDPAATSDNGTCEYTTTFELDLRCHSGSFTTPYLTGGAGLDGWCGSCIPMADPDGDNIWSVDVDLPPGFYVFKHTLDGWGGAQEMLDFNGSCVLDTDFNSYANRGVTVSDAPIATRATYDDCADCMP